MDAAIALEEAMKICLVSYRLFCKLWVVVYTLVIALSFSAATLAETRALVVAGIGGNSNYETEFSEQADLIATALATLTTVPEHVTQLTLSEATREAILSALQSIENKSNESDATIDTLILVFLGHGNTNRDGWQFNVSGPDFSVLDLVGSLAQMNIPQQVIVASTSSSGALLDVLDQPGRTLITATKSGGEINAVRFSEFFANALSSDKADVDRNELLTVKEAFTYANELTVKYYEDEVLLASEHARLLGADAVNVTLATLGALRDAKNNPAVAALLDERAELEAQFYAVKATKENSSSDDYYQRLEVVLVKIAALQQALDDAIRSGESAE